MKRYCNIIAVDSKKKDCLLVLKNETPHKDKYSLIGSSIEENDSAKQSIIKEFKKETGLIIPREELIPSIKLISPRLQSINYFVWISDRIYDYSSLDNNTCVVYKISVISNINCSEDLNWIIPLSLDNSVVKPVTLLNRFSA